jgi:type II secretory pathway component PulF
MHETSALFRILDKEVRLGRPILEVLRTMKSASFSEQFQKVMLVIICDIERGALFSEALEKHPNHFNNELITRIRTAERNGTLANILKDCPPE